MGASPRSDFEKPRMKSYYKNLRRSAPIRSTKEAGMDPLKSIGSIDPARRALSLLEEFKNFALKGSVIDLAVGVIIGAAFGKIVDSLVKHILMPFVGLLLPGEQGYLGWKIAVGVKEVPYGLFLGELVNFIVVALALYLFIVKFLGFVMKAKQVPTPAPSRQEALLAEIRDLLKAR
jgi:large conductance mechanosensitive channel